MVKRRLQADFRRTPSSSNLLQRHEAAAEVSCASSVLSCLYLTGSVRVRAILATSSSLFFMGRHSVCCHWFLLLTGFITGLGSVDFLLVFQFSRSVSSRLSSSGLTFLLRFYWFLHQHQTRLCWTVMLKESASSWGSPSGCLDAQSSREGL